MDARAGLVIVIAAAGLAGCHGGRAVQPVAVEQLPLADWRALATPADRERLRNWRTAWTAAAATAQASDNGALGRDPALFSPDRGFGGAAVPPAGAYRCRVYKLGSRGRAGGPGFMAYPAFDCRVGGEGEVVSFAKLGGSQRPVGQIYRDGPARGVFLGTLVLGDEARAMAYGRDANRDLIGIVQRIGERRWRLVLPEPRFESQLDVIELTAA